MHDKKLIYAGRRGPRVCGRDIHISINFLRNISSLGPPSACRNLRVRQERTRANTITVRWERPLITGRDDYYYDIFYSDPELPGNFKKHNLNPFIKNYPLVTYSVSGLRPLTNYTIRVVSCNGVSDQDPEGEKERRCEVLETTGDIRMLATYLGDITCLHF